MLIRVFLSIIIVIVKNQHHKQITKVELRCIIYSSNFCHGGQNDVTTHHLEACLSFKVCVRDVTN